MFANVRGDVPAKLGLRYEDLALVNEKVVCCFLSSYGMASSEQEAPGYDYVMQGRAGWMSLTGEPDGPPQKTGLSLVDYSTGLAAAVAMVAGAHGASHGRGSECDLALFDTAIGMLTYIGTWHLTAGYAPARTMNSAHPSLVPFQSFQSSDGWVVVTCAKEKFWERPSAASGARTSLQTRATRASRSGKSTRQHCSRSWTSASASARRRNGRSYSHVPVSRAGR